MEIRPKWEALLYGFGSRQKGKYAKWVAPLNGCVSLHIWGLSPITKYDCFVKGNSLMHPFPT